MEMKLDEGGRCCSLLSPVWTLSQHGAGGLCPTAQLILEELVSQVNSSAPSRGIGHKATCQQSFGSASLQL